MRRFKGGVSIKDFGLLVGEIILIIKWKHKAKRVSCPIPQLSQLSLPPGAIFKLVERKEL